MSKHHPRRRAAAAALIIGALLTLLGLASSPAAASYPGNNGRIAFVRANQIYTITPAGGGQRQLTSAGRSYRPHWSPDGKRIAFVHEVPGGSRDIWVMRADGSHKTQVTHLGQVTGATWSPDGSTLAFGGWSAADDHIVVMTIPSAAPFGAPTPLLGGTYVGDTFVPIWVDIDGTPTWSPTGAGISWYSHYFPSSPDSYMITFDVASGVYDAVNAIGGSCCGEGTFGDPAYSPSGVLGYTVTEDPNPPLLYAPGITTTVGQDEQLTWAPAGNRIAFMNDSSGAARVIIANANGSGRHVLTNGYQPDWQPLP